MTGAPAIRAARLIVIVAAALGAAFLTRKAIQHTLRSSPSALDTTLAHIVTALRVQYPDAVSVSPDGSLVILKDADSASFDLLIVRRTDDAVLMRVRGGDRQTGVAWRPDSRAVAYFADSSGDQRYGVHVIDLDRLTTIAVSAPKTGSPFAVWSPEGTRFAYIVDEVRSIRRSLTVLTLDATVGARSLAADVARVSGIAWSPTGTEIAVSMRRNPGAISIVALDGSPLRRLSVVERGEVREILWPPTVGCACIIATTRAASDEFVKLTRVALDSAHTWVIAHDSGDVAGLVLLGDRIGYHLVRDGERRAVVTSLTGADAHLIEPATGSTNLLRYAELDRVLIASHVGRTSPPRLVDIPVPGGDAKPTTLGMMSSGQDTASGAQSRVPYVAAERVDLVSVGGVRVPTYVWRARASGSHPRALILVHGGPALQILRTWDAGIQLLSESGVSVVAVNYRGSTGYGSSFEARGADIAGQVDDVLAAAAFVRSELKVDAQHTVIWGHSHGAQLTALSLLEAPAVAQLGIVVSLVGRLPATARSSRRIRVVAFHGQQDVVIRPEQARAILEAAFGKGAVDFTIFADEGHSPRRIGSWANVYRAVLPPLAQTSRSSLAVGSPGW
jgi:dipeptidyl aminopeptidase/acylaminoacyl peptidase